MSQTNDNSIITTARRALKNLAAIHNGGEIEPFLETLADDYEFYLPPLGEFCGRNVGRERVKQYYEQVTALLNCRFVTTNHCAFRPIVQPLFLSLKTRERFPVSRITIALRLRMPCAASRFRAIASIFGEIDLEMLKSMTPNGK